MAPSKSYASAVAPATEKNDEITQLEKELQELLMENVLLKKNDTLVIQKTDRKQVAIMFGTYAAKLFKSQWLKILENEDQLRKFMVDNASKLE
jgi:hypothetical protein